MEKRIFYHKGKPRNKYRVSRKLKKERKKEMKKFLELQKKLLMPFYGKYRFEHIILGG